MTLMAPVTVSDEPRDGSPKTSPGRETSLKEAWDWSILRRLVFKLDLDIIHIAPSPPLRRIVALDDRMTRFPEVGAGMAVRGLVAASDVPACAANPEMQPFAAHLQTVLAAKGTGLHFADGAHVTAGHHAFSFTGRPMEACSAHFA